MSPDLQRVARAIRNKALDGMIARLTDDDAEVLARAAILALRGIDRKTLSAMYDIKAIDVDGENLRLAFQCLIDCILSEKQNVSDEEPHLIHPPSGEALSSKEHPVADLVEKLALETVSDLSNQVKIFDWDTLDEDNLGRLLRSAFFRGYHADEAVSARIARGEA